MRFLAFPTALMLAACAHVDTGQTDYRVADRQTCNDASCKSQLAHKYLADQDPFQVGDVYSVQLVQAFIGPNLLEGHLFGRQFGRRGEFAILANTYEADATGEKRFLESSEYDSKGAEGRPKMKLIYYGDDIAAKQPLNFSYIPFVPRSKYDGGTIGIQIVIKEIDSHSNSVTSLLETLASYGKGLLPLSPQVSDIVFNLGTSLLAGPGDDRLLDYKLELRNAAAIAPDGSLIVPAAFAPGHYVIRKSDQRERQMNWSDLKFDHETGRVYRGDEEWRDELYLVLNISKYDPATAEEKVDFLDWPDFRDTLQQAANARGSELTAVTEQLAGMVAKQRSSQLRTEAARHWSSASLAMSRVAHRSATGPDGQCTVLPAAEKRRRDSDVQNLKDSIRRFVAAYQLALQPQAGAPVADAGGDEAAEEIIQTAEAAPEISGEDREEIVSLVARSFMPWDGDRPAEFNDAASFEAAYVNSGPQALTRAAEASATKRGGGCPATEVAAAE